MGDFNINILNCDSDKYITDFIDTMYASLLYPTTNTPTRITATPKILIDNIFCNEFTKKKKKKKMGREHFNLCFWSLNSIFVNQ